MESPRLPGHFGWKEDIFLAKQAQPYTKLSPSSNRNYMTGPADSMDLGATTVMILKHGIMITELIR